MTSPVRTTARLSILCTALALFLLAAPARGAFHLWTITEIYSNASGTLQFIELHDDFDNEQFTQGQQLSVSNVGSTITNTFTFPSNTPFPTANRFLLLGTAGIAAAGGPTPDFIIPNGFLFTAGGTINFFGANSGPYSGLPTGGTQSRNFLNGTNHAINSPTNFNGQTGVVPAPGTLALLAGGGAFLIRSRRRPAA